MSEPVATVHSLFRYPVKSMRGEELAEAPLTFQGVAHDRRCAFVQAPARSVFPWLTGRELPELLRYQPSIEMEGRRARVFVTSPEGVSRPAESDDLRAELEARSGRPLFFMQDLRGTFDIAYVSLIGLGTVAQIAAESDTAPAPARFRANIYVEASAYAEQAWVGRVLRIGDARVAVQQPDDRCVMITLDPETGDANPAVLRAVAQEHANQAGVYGVVLTEGTVRPGDQIYVE
jgi:uncharacterized protein YcbX